MNGCGLCISRVLYLVWYTGTGTGTLPVTVACSEK